MRTDKDYAKTKPRISGYLRGITAETTSNRIDLSDSDFVYNTLTIRQSTSESGEITVGAAIISSCNFTLWNYDGKFNEWNWTNSAAEIYLNFGEDTVYLGSYVIISHTTSGNTIKVEALDWLKVFDSHTLGECGITWPKKATVVIDTILATGVQNMLVSGLDTVTDFMLPDPADDEMTNRDALAYIAQCLGRFIISRSDEETKKTTLLFSWYDTNSAYAAGTTFSHNLRTDNINITGVEVTTADGSKTITKGDSAGYLLKISDNPFISPTNVATVANNIAASCLGLTFRPGDFVVLNNVRIEAGDVLTIDTHEEAGVLTLATDVTYKPAQVKESVVANAEEAAGDLQISKAAYVKKQIQNELNNENSDLNDKINSSISGALSNVQKNKIYFSKFEPYDTATKNAVSMHSTGGGHSGGDVIIIDAPELKGVSDSQCVLLIGTMGCDTTAQTIPAGTTLSFRAAGLAGVFDGASYPQYRTAFSINFITYKDEKVYNVFASLSNQWVLSFKTPVELVFNDDFYIQISVHRYGIANIS